MRWGLRIPLRDGTHLNGTLYLPRQQSAPCPVILTLTPYVSQSFHDRGVYFASYGYPFVAVDVRGRGNSEGRFSPFTDESLDGFDIVEWLAQQPYCDGQVAMWGGSYGGYAQWAVAKSFPPHLAAIAPAAPVYPGVDFPIRNNIAMSYMMQWLTYVSGYTLQDKLFGDRTFWSEQFSEAHKDGIPFRELDQFLGVPCQTFQEWVSHPEQDAYWDRASPTAEQYAKLDLPILTITGHYDADQPGALTYYRRHIRYGPDAARQKHHLVIGPWDHAGTRDPQLEFGGVKAGPASLVDLGRLHCEWYAWTLKGAPKPDFLKKAVAYYVMGAEQWRYADTLEEITERECPLYLQSQSNPTDVFDSGVLGTELCGSSEPDQYVYDPTDVSLAILERTIDPWNVTDQTMVHASIGKQLVYHSARFEIETELSGFFRLHAWLAIDRPDTDFCASVYEVGLDGISVLLARDSLRARYREGLREPRLIRTREPLRYDFEQFTFVSRLIRRGHRLRLVFGPINSIFSQKNYNSGKAVSEESMKDACAVTVRLFHDKRYPSALYVPIGRPEGVQL